MKKLRGVHNRYSTYMCNTSRVRNSQKCVPGQDGWTNGPCFTRAGLARPSAVSPVFVQSGPERGFQAVPSHQDAPTSHNFKFSFVVDDADVRELFGMAVPLLKFPHSLHIQAPQ